MRTGLSLNKPTYLCAKMTMRCNSRCAHCNIWQMPFDEPELSTDEWLRVLDDLHRWLGGFRMVFTGGEALLRDDMLEILCHAVRLGIKVELLSNGILIDQALASRLVSLGLEQITISYDGITAETHDRFRGDAGYHAATKGAIEFLVAERKKQHSDLNILLKTVISANNLHELTAIAAWAEEMGVMVQYQPIEQNYGDGEDLIWYQKSPLWPQNLDAVSKELRVLQGLKEGKGAITNPVDDFTRFIRYFENPDELMRSIQAHDKKRKATLCPAAVGNFVMESHGDVRMCFRMEPIGNVKEKPPAALWRERVRCWGQSCEYR